MKWEHRFLELAKHISTWSKDPSTKVGAVIVDDHRRVIGLGYNGFPRGVEDTTERLNDRPTKYAMVVHAEVNAVLNATQSVEGATVYIWPLMACNECAKVLIQSHIKRLVTPKIVSDRWLQSNDIAVSMFKEAGIEVIQLDFE